MIQSALQAEITNSNVYDTPHDRNCLFDGVGLESPRKIKYVYSHSQNIPNSVVLPVDSTKGSVRNLRIPGVGQFGFALRELVRFAGFGSVHTAGGGGVVSRVVIDVRFPVKVEFQL